MIRDKLLGDGGSVDPGMESCGQLDIYTERRANRIFDISDVGMRERGVKDDFLEFQPEQLNEQ